jgi:hypothetical protein
MVWIINQYNLWMGDHPPILKDGSAQAFIIIIIIIVCRPEFSPLQP